MILLLVLLASEPHITLGVVALFYILSGPAMDLYKLARGKKKITWKFRKNPPPDQDDSN